MEAEVRVMRPQDKASRPAEAGRGKEQTPLELLEAA